MKPTNRQCGECSLCCKVVAVQELNKPAGQWCAHFRRGRGCTVYNDRPQSCRAFDCHWLLDATMGEEWYPRRCKMVVQALETALLIHVDPDTHQPWRRAPYFPRLVALAGQLMAHGRMVIVLEKGHSILLLPDRMIDLGHLDAEDQIGLRQVSTANGPQWVARLVKRGREWLSSPVTYGKMPDTILPLPND